MTIQLQESPTNIISDAEAIVRERLGILDADPILTPYQVHEMVPATEANYEFINKKRQEMSDIINGVSNKRVLVVGPCSIHNTQAALEYAVMLKELQEEVKDELLLVMRVYGDKPRTEDGFMGIGDTPDLVQGEKDDMEQNDAESATAGMLEMRQLMQAITEMGVPIATEIVDIETEPYIADLATSVAIGARTVESQSHRKMASGLNMPVMMKNRTDGNVDRAINAIKFSAKPRRRFIPGLNVRQHTKGNSDCLLTLRGGEGGVSNCNEESIKHAIEALAGQGLNPAVMVDANHENSGKNIERQLANIRLLAQLVPDNPGIRGIMIESNILPGKQSEPKTQADLEDLDPYVSITDPCLGFYETAEAIRELAQVIKSLN